MLKAIKKLGGKAKLLLVSAAVMIAAAVPTFAEGSTGTANTQVTSAMTTVANDMVATGTAVVPIALTVIGLSMVVVFGIKIFKQVTRRS